MAETKRASPPGRVPNARTPRAKLGRKVALFLGGVLVASVALAILFGTEPTSLRKALEDAASVDRALLLRVRPPRVALAALSGGGLALVGAVFQALLRNPLAEPYVLGVSGGAALGATVAIALGLGAATFAGAAMLPVAALVGGLLATALVYAIARRGAAGGSGTSILLAGVMVNAIAAALITFLKTLVSPSTAQQLLRWLTGFIALPSLPALIFVGLYVAAGSALLVADAGRLNVLSLGAAPAESLGVDVRRLERRVFFACSCVVGAIVSVTGLIGFVGLVVPHALRRLVGADHRWLLPLSLLGGAAVLVVCDLVARLAFRALETDPPVGAVTAVLGGPLFLYMLSRERFRGA